MHWLIVTGLSLAVVAASAAATRVALGISRSKALMAHPNERSSHTVPTPHGGGLAVMAVLALAWGALLLFDGLPQASYPLVLGAALVLTAVSWVDDLHGLPVGGRLFVQALAVIVGLVALPTAARVWGGVLPFWFDRLAAFALWLWFVNLFNFMDGIDGLCGTETVALGLGVAAVGGLAGGAAVALMPFGLVVAAAALGFLLWNWPPARIFMGDAGSVPLGYLLGWLLLGLAADGHWAAALILPLYYLADATLTLGRRAVRGERVWQAHREHFYQRAVRGGLSHRQVTATVAAVDLGLIGLALWAELPGESGARWPALGAAAALVAGLLIFLGRRRALPAAAQGRR